MKCTVPVGTGRTLRYELDQRGLRVVGYASNPEFLREGCAIPTSCIPTASWSAPGRRAGDARAALYAPITDAIVRTDVASAELIKLASNAFLATKISFINEIANVCEEVGADVDEVARGMGLDAASARASCGRASATAGRASRRTSPRSSSSPATRGYHFQLLASVIEVNELQKRRVIGKLKRHLGSLRGRKVALWGLAFKPDTNDMREASRSCSPTAWPPRARAVTAYDPVVTGAQIRSLMPDVEVCASALDAADGADAVVIVTEWPEFRALVDERLRGAHGRPAGRRRPEPARPARPCAPPGSPTRASAAARTDVPAPR